MPAKNVPIYLPRKEWKLLAALLRMASDHFIYHGCTELDNDLVALLPESRWEEIASEVLPDRRPDDREVMQRDYFMMNYYGRLIDDASTERTNK